MSMNRVEEWRKGSGSVGRWGSRENLGVARHQGFSEAVELAPNLEASAILSS